MGQMLSIRIGHWYSHSWGAAAGLPCPSPQHVHILAQSYLTRGLDKMAANCEELKGQVEGFKGIAPLAAALRAPGMRPRHWEALSAQVRAQSFVFVVSAVSSKSCLRHLASLWRTAADQHKRARTTPRRSASPCRLRAACRCRRRSTPGSWATWPRSRPSLTWRARSMPSSRWVVITHIVCKWRRADASALQLLVADRGAVVRRHP